MIISCIILEFQNHCLTYNQYNQLRPKWQCLFLGNFDFFSGCPEKVLPEQRLYLKPASTLKYNLRSLDLFPNLWIKVSGQSCIIYQLGDCKQYHLSHNSKWGWVNLTPARHLRTIYLLNSAEITKLLMLWQLTITVVANTFIILL